MLDEAARRDTLYGYQLTEPEIVVNAERYKVSHSFEEEGVLFYAINRLHEVGAKVLIPNELWAQLDCGLKIAYTYNCVLSTMEATIV